MEALRASILHITIRMTTIGSRYNYKKLAGAIALCELIGLAVGIVALQTLHDRDFLTRQPGLPPDWVFGPICIILYLFMGIALYKTLSYSSTPGESYRHSLVLFWVQLTLNALWTLTFFGFGSPLPAFVLVLGLISAVCFWIMYLHKLHRGSAVLQIPYLLWCCFAVILNYYTIHAH